MYNDITLYRNEIIMKQLKTFASYAKIILVALAVGVQLPALHSDQQLRSCGVERNSHYDTVQNGIQYRIYVTDNKYPLCILAYHFIDRMFAKRSLVFCLVYAFAYLYVQKIGLETFQYNANGHDTVFPVILSGVISGFVYGICFRTNASTGGTDIISKYISLRSPQLDFFWVTFTINTVVAICSFFVYAKPDEAGKLIYDYKPVCLCILYCFISSYIGSYIIKGYKSACKFTVITSHADEITDDIIHNLKHGSTQITARGSYSHDEKEVIICVDNKHQIIDFKNMLKKYPDTFFFFETVNETYGNFKKIK